MAGRSRRLCFLSLVSFLSWAGVAHGRGTADLEVVPDHIRAGTFYHGADLSVTARTSLCDGAAIKIEGTSEEVVLNKKGKFGILWLNVAKLTVKNAPRVYILATSSELSEICSAETQRELGLGLEALRARIEFESNTPLGGTEFDEFLRLKEHSGAYKVDERMVLRPTGVGRRELSAVLPVPSTVPPGDYKVELYCFREGSLVEEAQTAISVEKTGLPRFMTGLSYEHAGAYGVMAIVVAMGAGVLMGVIFSSRGKRAH